MPIEFKGWLLLAMGCVVIAAATGGIAILVHPALTPGDRFGMFSGAVILGLVMGLVTPPLLLLGGSSRVTRIRDLLQPLALAAAISCGGALILTLGGLLAIPLVFFGVRMRRRRLRREQAGQ